jgi:violaxanthin de-epoxidase
MMNLNNKIRSFAVAFVVSCLIVSVVSGFVSSPSLSCTPTNHRNCLLSSSTEPRFLLEPGRSHHSRSRTTTIQLLRGQSEEESTNSNVKKNNRHYDFLKTFQKSATATAVAVGITMASFTATPTASVAATDSGAIVGCLFQKCQLPLLKCISNPKCLANVVCINTCNGRDDEIECQIQCGNLFENEVVGEFNKCVVSDMGCVPQKPDDGSYPVPDPAVLVPKFDTKMWNGKWYITAGQNPLFDVRCKESPPRIVKCMLNNLRPFSHSQT